MFIGGTAVLFTSGLKKSDIVVEVGRSLAVREPLIRLKHGVFEGAQMHCFEPMTSMMRSTPLIALALRTASKKFDKLALLTSSSSCSLSFGMSAAKTT